MLFDRKRHQMDLKQADATLQNVFKACHIPPNTVAFDRLALRRKLNTRIYNRLLAITALLLLYPAPRCFTCRFFSEWQRSL